MPSWLSEDAQTSYMAAGPPPVSISRESGESYTAMSDLLSESHAESLLPYVISQNSYRLPRFKGGDIDSPFSIRVISKSSGLIFKLLPWEYR